MAPAAPTGDLDFVQALAATLAADPARPSLVEDAPGDPGPVTAGALLLRAAALRAGLAARGLRAGDRVALLGPACVDWVATDLAALADGLVVVALDPRQAADDRAALLRGVAPALLVVVGGATAEGAGEAPSTSASALAAAAPGAAWAAPRALPGAAPATIVATSGSTGGAKGAVLTRANLDFMLRRTTRRLAELTGAAAPGGPLDAWPAPSPAADPERILQVLPPCYAGSRVLLLSALLRGARVRLLADPRRFGEALAAERPHTTLVVPLLLERLRRAVREGVAARGRLFARALAAVEAAWERLEDGRGGRLDRWRVAAARRTLLAPVRARLGPGLRGVICGSAPLDPAVQRFVRLLGVEVYQGYGLTETTALVTLDREGQVRPGWVGPPLPGVEVRLDAERGLLVRGPNVFAGYVGRPPGEHLLADGWLATGDLAEVDAAGRLRILGRADALLALTTGHKVPPEEVEDALRARLGPDAQVVVLGHGRPHLVALVAGATRAEVDAALAAHAAAASPSRRVHAAHLLPGPLTAEAGHLTPNLKLRRRAIAAAFAAEVEALYAAAPRPAPAGVA